MMHVRYHWRDIRTRHGISLSRRAIEIRARTPVLSGIVRKARVYQLERAPLPIVFREPDPAAVVVGEERSALPDRPVAFVRVCDGILVLAERIFNLHLLAIVPEH